MIRSPNEAVHHERSALENGMGCYGHLAAAFELFQGRTLGLHAYRGFGMPQRPDQLVYELVVRPALDAHGPLGNGRKAHIALEGLGNAVFMSQALHSCGRKDNRIELSLVEFSEPRVEVAPEGDDLDVRPDALQLARTPEARCAHRGAGGEFPEGRVFQAYEGVPGVFPLEDGTDVEPLGEVGGHVLHAVHGKVHLIPEHGFLDFLYEETLASHLCERNVENLIPRGLDLLELYAEGRIHGPEEGPDPFRLPEGQLASPSANGDGVFHGNLFS
jgi:hypothetical protein